MTIIINTWSPDTCSCILHFSWDDSVPPEERVHTFFAAERVCADHAILVEEQQQIAPTAITAKKRAADDKLNVVKNVLKDNRINVTRALSLTDEVSGADGGHKELVAPVKNVDEAKVFAQLQKHEEEVTERFQAILSTPFAEAEYVYDCVLDENRKKNNAIDEVTKASGKQDLKPEWHWKGDAPNRILEVGFKDDTDKDVVLSKKEQDALDKRFGFGKVKLL